MTQQLESIFQELGVAQYLDTFVDQGFDTWETILDITESDLDALGVKLGHRRKLQRRIANSRGFGPQTSLGLPAQPVAEDAKPEPPRPEPIVKEAVPVTVVTKRKYRRHPKPDENAPERPPSAYVLFSNKMREDLKGRNLTFTEIAKLVGENWQNLSQSEKEPFESQAQAAKEAYNVDLANYKKTPEYKKYSGYLQDFKAKYSHQSQEKEMSKRVRLTDAGTSIHSPDANATPERTSRSGSGSDAMGSMEPHYPLRQRRLDSNVSPTTDSHLSLAATPSSRHASIEDMVTSPGLSLERLPERSPTYGGSTSPMDIVKPPSRQNSGWADDLQLSQRVLPSLSDVLDSRTLLNSGTLVENAGFPFHRRQVSDSPGPVPNLVGSERRPPSLNKEQSSAGSTSSGSSYGFPRTPIEGSLPIHALLGNSKPTPTHAYDSSQHTTPLFRPGPLALIDHKQSLPPHGSSSASTPTLSTNGYHSTLPAHHGNSSYMGQPMAQLPPLAAQHAKQPDPGLDGMSALLKAGEMVDRRLG